LILITNVFLYHPSVLLSNAKTEDIFSISTRPFQEHWKISFFSHFLLKNHCYFIIVYTLLLDILYYLLYYDLVMFFYISIYLSFIFIAVLVILIHQLKHFISGKVFKFRFFI